jgi:hypothetical protein
MRVMETQTWASVETATANFGDERLNKRLIRILNDLSASPGSSIPAASLSWAPTKATYNFLASKKVSAESILQPHIDSTLERIGSQSVILAVQDTSEADFSTRRKTAGLGYLEGKLQLGFKFHSSIAITPEGGVLGLLSQTSWVRPLSEYGKKEQRKKRPTSQKETQHWLDVQKAAFAAVPADVHVISIGDREADFFEYFTAERPANADVLIRITHNRRVDANEQYLRQAIEEAPEVGRMSVEVGRSGPRPARTAQVGIRYRQLRIYAPSNRPLDASVPPWVDVTIILAREIDPPTKKEAIEWLLLTSLEINSLDEAITCVSYYSRRWLIERFHYTLKSGCGLEDLQLETAERLQKALALYSIVAWRLMWLLYQSRVQPEASSAEFLEREEWQILMMREKHLKTVPTTPPTLQDAVLWIAKLGGFLARKRDGTPGIKTMWRGLRRLNEMAETWKFLKGIPNTYG